MHHAVTWRLREEAKEARSGDKNSYSFVCTMRDVANAFPSMKHKALREMLEASTDGRTAALLRSRREQMEVKITTEGEGQVVIRPGCGGAQGDCIMPMEFRRAYMPRLEKWIQAKARMLGASVTAKDDVTGVDVGIGDGVRG